MLLNNLKKHSHLLFCAVFSNFKFWISRIARRLFLLLNFFYFLRALFIICVFSNFLFLNKWRLSILKFFRAPAPKEEVYLLGIIFLMFYFLYVLIFWGINLKPLFAVLFFSAVGQIACLLVLFSLFCIFFSHYFWNNPIPPFVDIFKNNFTLLYYAVVFYIFLEWTYSGLFVATFLFFEIFIKVLYKNTNYAWTLRAPLFGFYAGMLATDDLISSVNNYDHFKGYLALIFFASSLAEITGVPSKDWYALNNKIVEFDDFIFSGDIVTFATDHLYDPFELYSLVLIIVFGYVYRSPIANFIARFFILDNLRKLTGFFILLFIIYFIKYWVFFHFFIFVIFLVELFIYFITKWKPYGSKSDIVWLIRLPLMGFLVGIITMCDAYIHIEVSNNSRGFIATWIFIFWLRDTFDFSYKSIHNFHDLLISIDDFFFKFYEFFFSHTLFSNALYAVIYAVTVLTIIIVIAFFTVFERKVLAAVQRRRGPNIVGVWGLLQAIADGLKLLSKEPLFVSGVNYYIFLMAPIILFTISLTAWAFVPIPGYEFNINSSYTFLLVFLITGLNSFAIILAGISSNSRYSLIGGIRAIAQLISYEIPLSVSILILFIIQGSFDLHQFIATKIVLWAVMLPALGIFFICLLAETNRTPFDLPEAEAELVAGYNLEYSSILFSLFFLAEYNNIMIASSLLSIMIFGESLFYVGVIFFCLVIIFVRAILPRYTFAQLINLCWTALLPLAIFLLILTVILMFLFDVSDGSFLRQDIIETAHDVLKNSRMIIFAGFGEFLFVNILNTSAVTPKFNVFIFFVVSFVIVSLLVILNWIFVNFKANNRKNSPYECGFEPVGSPISDFTPNFLAVALIFLIYDVEILLTFPWAYSFYAKTVSAVFCFIFFLIIMLLGLIYEILDDSFHVY